MALTPNLLMFLDVKGLGLVDNARNAQRQDPAPAEDTVLVPYNSPPCGASRPGVVHLTGDYNAVRYVVIDYAGSAGQITAGIPPKNLDNSTLSGVQSAYSAGDNSGVGSGINTDYTEANERTRNYYRVWIATETNVARGINPLIQPNGRLAQSAIPLLAFKSITLTQDAALQKVTITVPDARGTNPVVPGITDSVAAGTSGGWSQGVVCVIGDIPTDEIDRAGMPWYWIGQVTAAGGTVIDCFDEQDFATRGLYYPSTFLNFPATRAVCAYQGIIIAGGGGESVQGPIFGTNYLADGTGVSTDDKPYFVSVSAPSKTLALRRGTSTTNKPRDPRTCQISSAVVSGGGATVTVTVINYHYFAAGSVVYFAGTGITGLDTMALAVTSVTSETVFVITPGGTPFSGPTAVSGICMLNVMTTQDWWIGKQLDLGTFGSVVIEEQTTDGGTDTAIIVDKTLSITSPQEFRIVGQQFLYIGITDPRGYAYAPAGLRLLITGITGPLNAIVSSADGVFIYGNSDGARVNNVPIGLGLKGNLGATAAQKPFIDPNVRMEFGVAGPNAWCYGQNAIIGYSSSVGVWVQFGTSQQLLDPQQKYAEFYARFRFSQDGLGDQSAGVSMAYSQQLNMAFVVFQDYEQFLCVDFRTPEPTINIWNMFIQKPVCVAKMQLYRPVGQVTIGSPGFVPYVEQDSNANVGDVIVMATQTGDLLEINDNFFSDFCILYGEVDTGDSMLEGVVTAITPTRITADINVSLAYAAGNSPTGGTAIWMTRDTTLIDGLKARTVVGVTLDGTGQYAEIFFVDSNHGVIAGSHVSVYDVVGITGLNSPRLPADPILLTVSDTPSPSSVEVDGGAPGAFTGVYVDGGKVRFSTWPQRFGSWGYIFDIPGEGKLGLGSNPIVGEPPVPGDIVAIQPLYITYDSPDMRYGKGTRIEYVDSFQMENDAYFVDQYVAVRFRQIPSGLQTTTDEGAASTSDYPGAVISVGGVFALSSAESGNSVRLRVEWLNATGGKSSLDSLTMAVTGERSPRNGTVTLNRFPQGDRRVDKAKTLVVLDQNVVRKTDYSALESRPGTRVLTVDQNLQRPVDANSGAYGITRATLVKNNITIVRRVGGSPWICVSTSSTYEMLTRGSLYGTLLMVPFDSMGTIGDAIPESSFY